MYKKLLDKVLNKRTALPNTKQRGNIAEQAAQTFLCKQGLVFIAQNYSCRQGEIDIIMSDNDVLVFIEVRLRTHKNYGSPFESVTQSKQHKIRQTAEHYLQHTGISAPCRFDVIGIDNDDIKWIKSAF